MWMRAFAVIVAIGILPSTGLFASAAPERCEEARSRFTAAWAASGHAPSPTVVEAAREVFDACPRDGDSWTWAQSAGPEGVKIHLKTQGLLAMRCGFREKSSGAFADAPIVGTIQYLGSTKREYDHGPATLTYDPSTNVTEYTVTGTNWTLSATNNNFGYIVVRGALFPIAYVNGITQAGGGCGLVPSPTLCWGYGYGNARVGSVAVSASSKVQEC